jgi:hypothetical protein
MVKPRQAVHLSGAVWALLCHVKGRAGSQFGTAVIIAESVHKLVKRLVLLHHFKPSEPDGSGVALARDDLNGFPVVIPPTGGGFRDFTVIHGLNLLDIITIALPLKPFTGGGCGFFLGGKMGFYHFPGFLTVNHCGHMPPHGFIDSIHYLVHGRCSFLWFFQTSQGFTPWERWRLNWLFIPAATG